MSIFSGFDRSGRTPRPVQEQILQAIEKHSNVKNLVLSVPTAGGKSAISKAIQYAYKCPIIVPSNILLEQYDADYPDDNSLKGLAHYICSDTKLQCADMKDLGFQCCGCHYTERKLKAVTGFPTIFNPMSLYYLQNWTDRPQMTVVDEFHTLVGMLRSMAGKNFSREKYGWKDKHLEPIELMKFLCDLCDALKEAIKVYREAKDFDKLKVAITELNNIDLVRWGLKENQQNYVIREDKSKKGDRLLNVTPIFAPRRIVEAVIGKGRRIFLSGTCFEHDVRELVGNESFTILEFDSPIDKSRRLIRYTPVNHRVNKDTPPEDIALAIKKVIAKHPNVNTLVHVSYALNKKLEPFVKDLPKVLHHTADNKIAVVEQFKKEGGILFGSGCADGLDLKGDLCRLTIIPQLLFPNLGDPVVQKRKALTDGDKWYACETLKITIQQASRSTRTPEDYSDIYILDPSFARVILQVQRYEQSSGVKIIPKYFVEAIKW